MERGSEMKCLGPKVLLFLVIANATPLSAQASGPRRQVNLFATGWIGATTEQSEDRLPLSPQMGLRMQLASGRIWAGAEGTLDFVQAEPSDGGDSELTYMKGLSGLFRVNLGTGQRLPYLLGSWGKRFTDEEDFTTYGAGLGLFMGQFLLGRAGQVELRYRGDDRQQSGDSGRWEVGIGLGVFR
jgi:hypothetical protein